MSEILRKITGPYMTNSYILIEEKGVSIIDAPFPALLLYDEIKKQKKELLNIFLTHAHFDHTLAIPELLALWPEAKIYLSEPDFIYFKNHGEETRRQLRYFDPQFLAEVGEKHILNLPQDNINFIKDGDIIDNLEVIATPGHTKGSVCFYHKEQNFLFSGDTLFQRSVGRVDLGGNGKELSESLKKLMLLPVTTVVCPGHGEITTIGEEQLYNPYIN